MQAAKTQRELTRADSINATTGNLFVISGDRGTGKTTWTNYALSKHRDLFDNHKILWIRLNAHDSIHFYGEESLWRFIHAQVLRVLLRYYDPASSFFDPNGRRQPLELAKLLADRIAADVTDLEMRHELQLQLLSLKAVLQKETADEPLTADLVSDYLGRLAKQIALDHGYSFIVLIDGADQLEATDEASTRFIRISTELKYIATQARVGMAFVVICRSTSLDRIAGPSDGAYRRGLGGEAKIAAASLGDIINHRVRAIIREVRDAAKATSWDMSDWPTHFSTFVETIDPSRLISLFGQNRRAQMQAIQLQYYYYLHQHQKRGYVMLEQVMTMGRPYPPQHFTYREHEGRWCRIRGDRLAFDTRFLPSIYSVPRINGLTMTDIGTEAALMGVRILQLVYYHDAASQMSDALPLKVSDILAILQAFDYRAPIVRALVEEYQSYELIRVINANENPELDFDHHGLAVLPKAIALLGGVAFDLAYLNLAAMRLPLARPALEQKPPFIKAGVLDYSSVAGLARWVGIKMCNAVAMLRLCRHVNAQQHARISEITARLPEALRQEVRAAANGGMFQFIDHMDKVVQEQLDRSVHELSQSADPTIFKQIEEDVMAYGRRWI